MVIGLTELEKGEDMADEVLKEIALMEGRLVEGDQEMEPSEELEVTADAQESEEREEEQASDEAEEGREVLEEDEEAEESIEDRYARLLNYVNEQSAQLNALRDAGYQVGEMGTQQVSVPPTPVREPPAGAGAPPPVPVTSWQLDESLLTRALVEDDPAAMKELLVGMYNSLQQSSQTMKEQILVETPRTVQAVARQQLAIMRAVDQFYVDNPDLLQHSNVVGAAANRIVAKEPNLSMQEAFEKAEKEARTILGLKKRVQKVDAEEGRGKPAFAKTKASRKPGAPVIQGLRGEIGRMQEAKW
jgi:hypothetical protein